jgi:hypothetical protein
MSRDRLEAEGPGGSANSIIGPAGTIDRFVADSALRLTESMPTQDQTLTDDVDAGHEDIDHYTCCDPHYYLATDRPIYAMCGRKVRPDDVIKLQTDGTPICATCLECRRPRQTARRRPWDCPLVAMRTAH